MHWHSLREHQVNLKEESKENSTSDPLRPSVNHHLILSAGGFVSLGILRAPLQQAPGSVLCRETPGVTLAKRPPSWPQQSIDSQALEGDSGGLRVEKKNGLTGKDPDAGKDWGQRRREWQRTRCLNYIRLNEHEFEQAPGDGEGQGSLACCSPWGHRVRHSWATGQQPLEKCSCGRRPMPSGDPTSSPSHFQRPWSQLLAAAASVRRKPRLSLSWIEKCFERDVKGKMSKRKCEEKGNGGGVRERAFLSICCCLVTESCLTLCNLMDCNPPHSSVHGIFQARILGWIAISSSRESFRPRDGTQVSYVAGRFFTIGATREALLSITFSEKTASPWEDQKGLSQGVN